MQVVAQGPDIPSHVLEAHEEGKLVFLCGAGISRTNGLPLFSGLVDAVWKDLGSANLPDFDQAMHAREYDRALTRLEAHYPPATVRRSVQKILAVPESPDTSTHAALIDLGTTPKGHLQQVTTNFDLLFEAARPGVLQYAAPTLPVPKPGKWNALVYLHGRIDTNDPDGLHLVLTSADFGTAYLTERWASQFVSGLFAHFTVLFVGYSVSDPVMRYLLDALAAERRLGGYPREAFVFAPLREGMDPASLGVEWTEKNVTAIPYKVTVDPDDGAEDHGLLYDSIKEWARLWRGGITSRKNVASDLGRKDPDGLSDGERSRLLWAISDRDVAKYFADLGTDTSIKWLQVFDQANRLGGISTSNTRNPLVDSGDLTQVAPNLDDVSRQLARWAAKHVASEDLVRWIIHRGSHLHPQFCDAVNASVANDEVLEKIWRMVLAPDILVPPQRVERQFLYLKTEIEQRQWEPSLRISLLRAFRPVLHLGRTISFGFDADEYPAGGGQKGVSDLATVECEVAAGPFANEILTSLRARDDSTLILTELALDATSLLRTALELFAALDQAGMHHDPGTLQQPSIAPHPQNNHLHGWVFLIELCRDCFDALLEVDELRAHNLLREWSEIKFPVFRRLTIYGLRGLIE